MQSKVEETEVVDKGQPPEEKQMGPPDQGAPQKESLQ